MIRLIFSVMIVAGLITGSALAETAAQAQSDDSTLAVYTLRTVQARGPDHAQMRKQHRCQDMGYKLGTDAFANCLLRQETNRTQRRAAEAKAQANRDAATIRAKAARNTDASTCSAIRAGDPTASCN